MPCLLATPGGSPTTGSWGRSPPTCPSGCCGCWVPAGIRSHAAGFVADSAGTLRRVLIALDADGLDARWGRLAARARRLRWEGSAIALDGKDLVAPGTRRANWCCSRRWARRRDESHDTPWSPAAPPGSSRHPQAHPLALWHRERGAPAPRHTDQELNWTGVPQPTSQVDCPQRGRHR